MNNAAVARSNRSSHPAAKRNRRGPVQGVLPSLMKVTYWGTPFPRVLAHGATHAHQLKESQAKTLSLNIITMGRKNVNRVNCSETVETPANYYKSVENVRPFIAFDASRTLNEWVETGDDEMISLHGLDLTIKNEPGVVLPSTGGPVRRRFTLPEG